MNFMPRRRRKPEIIIVSLIDIFAILLIFMVMNTQFKTEQPEVTIKLPESKSAVAQDNPGRPVILSISENEEIFLDAKRVAIYELKEALAGLLEQSPPPRLALNADKKTPFGTIIKVLDVLKESGVKGSLSAFTDVQK